MDQGSPAPSRGQESLFFPSALQQLLTYKIGRFSSKITFNVDLESNHNSHTKSCKLIKNTILTDVAEGGSAKHLLKLWLKCL